MYDDKKYVWIIETQDYKFWKESMCFYSFEKAEMQLFNWFDDLEKEELDLIPVSSCKWALKFDEKVLGTISKGYIH